MAPTDLLDVVPSDEVLKRATPEELREYHRLARVALRPSQWVPHVPTAKQTLFLSLSALEAFYGGAAGPGKSDALLMAALQYVDEPDYAALLLRRTFQDLALPGALMARSHEWLDGTAAHWREKQARWEFPTGSTLSFGYLESDKDRFRYKSAEFQFIGFDELTGFSELQYTFLFWRLRRLMGSTIPPRMRGASNPGDMGHDWVKARFIPHGEDGRPVPDLMTRPFFTKQIHDEETDMSYDRVFVPARKEDNPYLDVREYERALANLDPITRAQLSKGLWLRPEGGMYKRTWFLTIPVRPVDAVDAVRHWDLAATKSGGDFTAGALMLRSPLTGYVIADVRRVRESPAGIEALVKQTAAADGKRTKIRFEQERGSAGANLVHMYQRLLEGYDVRGVTPTGGKDVRAGPLASQAESGNVKIVHGDWNAALLDELEAFPNGEYDDQVDACSGAFEYLAERASVLADVIPIGLKRQSPWRIA